MEKTYDFITNLRSRGLSLAAATNPSLLSALADAAIPLHTRRARAGGSEDGEPGKERCAEEEKAVAACRNARRHSTPLLSLLLIRCNPSEAIRRGRDSGSLPSSLNFLLLPRGQRSDDTNQVKGNLFSPKNFRARGNSLQDLKIVVSLLCLFLVSVRT